ncbi:MAG: nuclear transport factor 2 family protein [Sphingomonadaceae bacterium]
MTDTTIIDRMYDGLTSGDVAVARNCFTADAVIWHGFDRIAMNRDAAASDWQAMCDKFPERGVSDVRCQPTPTGLVQQHVWHMRTSEGKAMAWPVCLVVEIRDGLIARIDEYIDRAGWFEG